MNIKRLQKDLKALGLYQMEVDGLWGPGSEAAYQDLLALASSSGVDRIEERSSLAWGSKVSEEFRDKVVDISEHLGIDPDWLMTCIAFESAGTFRADVKNMAGSGATGLIQFMPSTARAMGTTVDALAAMSEVEQLDYVYAYFLPYEGRLGSLADVYMAILWPRAIGESEAYVLWDRDYRPTTYRQNSGLDTNQDGKVTKAEASKRLGELQSLGRRLYLA